MLRDPTAFVKYLGHSELEIAVGNVLKTGEVTPYTDDTGRSYYELHVPPLHYQSLRKVLRKFHRQPKRRFRHARRDWNPKRRRPG
jgi:hypothetical protein